MAINADILNRAEVTLLFAEPHGPALPAALVAFDDAGVETLYYVVPRSSLADVGHEPRIVAHAVQGANPWPPAPPSRVPGEPGGVYAVHYFGHGAV